MVRMGLRVSFPFPCSPTGLSPTITGYSGVFHVEREPSHQTEAAAQSLAPKASLDTRGTRDLSLDE